MNPFSQEGYTARLAWGPRGARMAADRGDILVVVDVLRFSSATAAAVAAGVELIPAAPEDAAGVARERGSATADMGIVLAAAGRFSLSPASFSHAEPGTRVVISSANGTACARSAESAPYVFTAGLVNARAVGRAVDRLARERNVGVTVLACGERWPEPSEEGDIRFAIEDYLGAGAVLSHLRLRLSAETEVCRAAFEASRNNLRGLVWECGSGQELVERGLEEDVIYCSALNVMECVPVLEMGTFRGFQG